MAPKHVKNFGQLFVLFEEQCELGFITSAMSKKILIKSDDKSGRACSIKQ